MVFSGKNMYDVDDLDQLGDWETPETGLEGGDDPCDEAPFTAEELLRLAAELLPEGGKLKESGV